MFKQTSNNPSGSWTMILLLIIIGAAALMISPVSADMGVTIAASGVQSYYLGEKVVLSGHNYDSDSTYLFITGPGIANGGGKLTLPQQDVVSGDPGSFTVVKTNPDKTWDYPWYTSGLRLDAGTYTVYAVSKPKTEDQLAEAAYGTTGIIIKKPYITANISSLNIVKGQPFTVTGIAVGVPPEVQIWIFGDNYAFTTTTPVNPDASFTFNGDATTSGKLPAGQNYLIVQHPMADNQFDIVVSGDYVRDLKLNNGTNLFKLTGPGSLQGNDAADTLTATLSKQEVNDNTYTNDTYTVVPFQVTDAGSPTSQAIAVITAPVQSQAQPAFFPFALIGAIILILGIVLWSRR
jgi:hypothetical protein